VLADPIPNPQDGGPLARDAVEWSRLKGIVQVIAWTIAVGAVPPIVHNAYSGKLASAVALLLAEVGVLVALVLNRRGRLDAAVGVLVATVQCCAGILVIVGSYGFHDVAMLLFPATLVVAGLLLNRLAFAAVAAGTVLFVAAIGLAEMTGLVVTPLSRFTNARNLVDAVIILGVTAVAVALLAESVRTSLAQARENEATVEAANAELVEQARRLRVSEERFRSLIDLAVDGTCRTSCATPRRWKRSAASRGESPTTSTTRSWRSARASRWRCGTSSPRAGSTAASPRWSGSPSGPPPSPASC
jgi:hypothetical protein